MIKDNNKSIFINASNCHQGGGKTLLDAFISGIDNPIYNYIFFIDKRYIPPKNKMVKLQFKVVSIWERVFVSFRIIKIVKKIILKIFPKINLISYLILQHKKSKHYVVEFVFWSCFPNF